MPPRELRALVRREPMLADASLELIEQALDEAEATILDGLRSTKLDERMRAASFLLNNSPGAKRRGWG